MSSLFKNYGVGLGLRPPHYEEFMNKKPSSVNWGEVVSENFLPVYGNDYQKPFHNLVKMRREMPIALHGVSLSLGSADDLNFNYLKHLKDLKNKIEPMWISDHLCWTGVNGENLHDLLPLPYTEDVITHVVDKIHRVQDYLGERIVVENLSSYIEYKHSEMSEWDFLREIALRSECGILLDVNNVYVSSVNHDFDPKKYIDAIPAQLVAQIHLAGHSIKNGYLIDTHDTAVCPEVWDLYRYTIQKMGFISTMLERDANLPTFNELESEILNIEKIKNEIQPK